MPGRTATSIVTQTTAGRNGITAPGTQCSRRPIRPPGARAERMVGSRTVGSVGSTAAAMGNWNRTVWDGSLAKDASAVAADSGDKPPSGRLGGSLTVQRMIVGVTASALIALAGPALAQ